MTKLVAQARVTPSLGGECILALFAGKGTSENENERRRAEVGARLVHEGLQDLRRLARSGNG